MYSSVVLVLNGLNRISIDPFFLPRQWTCETTLTSCLERRSRRHRWATLG